MFENFLCKIFSSWLYAMISTQHFQKLWKSSPNGHFIDKRPNLKCDIEKIKNTVVQYSFFNMSVFVRAKMSSSNGINTMKVIHSNLFTKSQFSFQIWNTSSLFQRLHWSVRWEARASSHAKRSKTLYAYHAIIETRWTEPPFLQILKVKTVKSSCCSI